MLRMLCLQLHFIFRHKNPLTGTFEVNMLQLSLKLLIVLSLSDWRDLCLLTPATDHLHSSVQSCLVSTCWHIFIQVSFPHVIWLLYCILVVPTLELAVITLCQGLSGPLPLGPEQSPGRILFNTTMQFCHFSVFVKKPSLLIWLVQNTDACVVFTLDWISLLLLSFQFQIYLKITDDTYWFSITISPVIHCKTFVSTTLHYGLVLEQ